MSNLSEEIIKVLTELISWQEQNPEIRVYEIKAIQGLLDLYNKEKNKYSDDKIRETIIKRYHEVIEKDYISKEKIRNCILKYRCFGWHNKDDEYWANRMLDGFEELLEE